MGVRLDLLPLVVVSVLLGPVACKWNRSASSTKDDQTGSSANGTPATGTPVVAAPPIAKVPSKDPRMAVIYNYLKENIQVSTPSDAIGQTVFAGSFAEFQKFDEDVVNGQYVFMARSLVSNIQTQGFFNDMAVDADDWKASVQGQNDASGKLVSLKIVQNAGGGGGGNGKKNTTSRNGGLNEGGQGQQANGGGERPAAAPGAAESGADPFAEGADPIAGEGAAESSGQTE